MDVIFVVSRDWFVGQYESMRLVIAVSKQLTSAVYSWQHGKKKQGKGALTHLFLRHLSLEPSHAQKAALEARLQLWSLHLMHNGECIFVACHSLAAMSSEVKNIMMVQASGRTSNSQNLLEFEDWTPKGPWERLLPPVSRAPFTCFLYAA